MILDAIQKKTPHKSLNTMEVTILNIDSFLRQLGKPNPPDWLLVAVDCRNTKHLYLLTNGGLGNINCAPIEQYPAEMKYGFLCKKSVNYII
jgi:hypothetical protein